MDRDLLAIFVDLLTMFPGSLGALCTEHKLENLLVALHTMSEEMGKREACQVPLTAQATSSRCAAPGIFGLAAFVQDGAGAFSGGSARQGGLGVGPEVVPERCAPLGVWGPSQGDVLRLS